MTESKLYKLIDLIDEINKVEVMIQIHKKNEESNLMIRQYNARKLKLTRELISELVSSPERSNQSMLVIKSILDKFYSNTANFKDSDSESTDYKKLIDAL